MDNSTMQCIGIFANIRDVDPTKTCFEGIKTFWKDA